MRAGVGQGITNAFNNYEQGQEQADASQMRKLQMEQLKKAIANQDAAALKDLADDALAQKAKPYDPNYVPPPQTMALPNTAAPSPQMQPPQNQPMPQPPNPGQASVPNPVNQSVMNQGQVFQRPPQMPPQAPPQVPQGGPRPPQPPQPMGMINQVAPQSVMQTPQMQMQAPQQPRPVIPPYQSAANLQPKPPVQQPQMSNASPPDPAKLQQIQQAKQTMGEAKENISMEDNYFKQIQSVIKEGENKKPEIQKQYEWYANQGIPDRVIFNKKLNMTPDKYFSERDKQQTRIDEETKTRIAAIKDAYEIQDKRKRTEGELGNWKSEAKNREGELSERTRHDKAEESISRLRENREKITEKTGTLGYKLAEIQALKASGQLSDDEASDRRDFLLYGKPSDKKMSATMRDTVDLDIKELHNSLQHLNEMKDTSGSLFFDEKNAGAYTGLMHREITPANNQVYDVYANRIATAIASIQTMGRGQISDAKVSEARKLVPRIGDDPETVKVKKEQIKYIMDSAQELMTKEDSNKRGSSKTESKTTTSEDSEAVKWAKANPNDPRSKAILGAQ